MLTAERAVKRTSRRATILSLPQRRFCGAACERALPVLRQTAREASTLIIDMAVVEEIDRRGLAVLLALLDEVEARRGVMAICNLKPAVRLLVQLVRLHTLIDVYRDVISASQALAER